VSTGRSTEGWRVLDEAVGLVDASAHRSIVARGEERVRFLQGQLSQDIASLVTGSGAAALALNVQGRVQELFTVYAFDDRLELVVDADRLPSARARLEQFLVADDVEFDLEAPTERISLAGPGAPDLLRRAGVTCSVAPGSWSVAEGKIAGDDVRAYVRGQWRVPWIELVVVGDAAPVRRTLASLGAVPVEIDAAETVRIESGIARLGVDVDEDRIATEARLEWAIHFAKGCYVGQEVVSRIEHRGTARNRVVPVALEGGTPGIGVPVRAGGKQIGTTGSMAVNHGLAMLRLDRVADAGAAGLPLTAGSVTIRPRKPEWARFTWPGEKAAG
jgi:folate-binding protein YgfZ